MLPSAGQTDAGEGKVCPQCGLLNYTLAHYCYNCRFPLKSTSDLTVDGNGKAHLKASTAVGTAPPPNLERSRLKTQPRRGPRLAIPWGMVLLSWLLLSAAAALGYVVIPAGDLLYQVLSFILAMLAVGIGAALLRERAWPARLSGWLVLLTYVVLQIIAVRAILEVIKAP